MLGPTGLGILYGKRKHLEKMPPFLLGGSMIKTVSRKETTFAEIPAKFEAGTPPIAEVIAFGETIKYLSEIGMENIAKHEKNLMSYAIEKFSQHQQIKIYTPKNPEKRGPIISFTIKGIHPHDIASIFDQFGIAIRAGHHCAQPLMNKLNIPATARISFYLYNTVEEVDKAEEAIKKILEIFK
jgi:cysteine desulfurase/selenocysteine lyase